MKGKPAFQELTESDIGINKYSEVLEELLEDIEFEVKLNEGEKRSVIKTVRETMNDQDTATLLAELIKEELLSELREALDQVISTEVSKA